VAHTIDPLALSVALADFAKSKGMTFQQGAVTQIAQAETGVTIMTDNETNLLSRPVASAERRFIITPMDNTLRLAGTVEYAGLYAPANNKRADMLKDNAAFILKSLPEEQTIQKAAQERWMGCRPSLPDSLPVICQAPNHDKIFFALGHQHLGLTQGVVTGKLIGQLVSKQATEIDVSAFCISRFN